MPKTKEKNVRFLLNKKIPCSGLKRASNDLAEAANVPLFFGPYGPDWYQELSDRQMAAADALGLGVIEDIEQDTVDRCQRLLYGIGIKPIVKKSDLRLLLRLSKGNDIAFLWYMLEVFYRTPDNDANLRASSKYTVNERLMLSTIMHLNMTTILRELHEMYPPVFRKTPPNPAKRFTKKTRPMTQSRRHVSPYLEPLPRPAVPESRSLPRPKLPGPNFEPYTMYMNARLYDETEDKRWFAVNADGLVANGKCPLCRCLVDCNRENSAEAIVQEMFAKSTKRDNAFYGKLMDEFQTATRCYCLCNHPDIAWDSPAKIPVHPSQFEAAATSAEFRHLLTNYKIQLLVCTLVKYLLYEQPVHLKLPNIRVCVNCAKCRLDCDRLKWLVQQNARRPMKQTSYEHRTREFLFGSKSSGSPVTMLTKFNEIAGERGIELHICVKDVWQYELRLWSDIVETCACTTEATPASSDSIAPTKPNDPITLDRELIDMFAQLRDRDPRFVIAFLPDAHKIPVLREWLAVRRGLVYKRSYRLEALDETRNQLSLLDRYQKLTVHVPDEDDVCRSHSLNYNRKANVMACIGKLRDAYNHRLNVALINDARRLWPIMRPYLTTSGPPRKLFYAYMPGCEYDVLPTFRPWQLGEMKEMVLWTNRKAAVCEH